MCKIKYSFSRLSIFFILLMGTFAYLPKKSTPDHAGPTADNREKDGHTGFHARQLRMGNSNADENLENQREESNPDSVKDPEIEAGSKAGRDEHLENQGEESKRFTAEDPEIYAGSKGGRETSSFGFMIQSYRNTAAEASRNNVAAIFRHLVDDLLDLCLRELSLFPFEQRRMRGPDYTLVDTPKVSEGNGTEGNINQRNQRKQRKRANLRQGPDQRKGKTRPDILQQVDHSEPKIIDKDSSGKEGRRFHKMDKDGQRMGQNENAHSCRANETEDLPDYTLGDPPKVSEGNGTEGNNNQRNQRKQRKREARRANLRQGDQTESDIVDKKSSGNEGPEQRNGKTRPEILVQVDRSESNIVDKKSSGNEDIATMGKWTLFVSHVIVFLVGLAIGYCMLRLSKKQPNQETEDVDPTIIVKNTEDTERHTDQRNADTFEVISWETQKENQQQQKDRSQSYNDSKHKLDCGEDKAKSQTWTGQQPAIETGRTFAYKTDYIHPQSKSEAGMQKPEENKGGNDSLGESDRSQLIHSGSKSDAEQKTCPAESKAELPTAVGQQTDSKSEDSITNRLYEDQPVTSAEFELKGSESMLRENDALGESERGQLINSGSKSGAEQKMGPAESQAELPTAVAKQPVSKPDDSITNKLYEDQPVTSPEFELKGSESMPRENEFKGNAALPQEIIQETPKENKQHQEDRRQSVNNSEFKLDADQVQPTSQPRAGQQPAIESKKYIVKKADEVQTLSTPGAEMQSHEENVVGNELSSATGHTFVTEFRRAIANKAEVNEPAALPLSGKIGVEANRSDKVVEQLHMRHLQDQSKHWKGTEIEGSLLTEKRNIDEFYTDLCVIATSPKRLFIEHDEMQEESNKQDFQVDFHQLFKSGKSLTNNAAITVVCGAAGSGKSTMIQKIIHDWSTGTIYKEFKFVLHFTLRQLNAIKCKTNLNTLILDAYPHFKGSLDHLWKETNNILFILEDFDQFEGIIYYQDEMKKENKQQEYLEPQSLCLVSDIVKSLLQGDMLRGCSVLITTRPWNLDTLREASIDSTFQIIGFTADQVKQYFLRNGLQANVIKLIEQSDILCSMCRNPLFCSALCASVNSQQGQGEGTTYVIYNSRVFSAYYAILLDRCGYNVKSSRNSFHKLGELAYTGICNKKESFESEKLSDLNLYLPNFASTVMIQVQDNDMTASVYKFTHAFVRDFVAAVSKRLYSKGIELQRILDQSFTSTDDRWNIFSRFLFGLCSGQSTDRLEGLLGKCNDDVSLCISDWLSETIKRRIENLEGKYNQKKFLNILHCLSEFGDVQLTKNTLTVKPAIKFNQCVLRPSDCTVICTTLTCPEAITEMDLSSCRLQLEGIQQLETVLHKCEILRLSGNDLQDAGVKCVSEALKKDDCKVKQLELKSNKLTDDCLEDLFCALAGNRSLMVLDLSNSTHDEHQANRFTAGNLQNMEQSCNSNRDIRLICYQDFEQNPSKDDIALNVLTIITD
ncbi:uncharacterized protein LOC132386050 isoform X2 [Hypanus sabinus]|nr:uncharacterized protein LOC132386050 isoform X2 [Hypanus sabinus]